MVRGLDGPGYHLAMSRRYRRGNPAASVAAEFLSLDSASTTLDPKMRRISSSGLRAFASTPSNGGPEADGPLGPASGACLDAACTPCHQMMTIS